MRKPFHAVRKRFRAGRRLLHAVRKRFCVVRTPFRVVRNPLYVVRRRFHAMCRRKLCEYNDLKIADIRSRRPRHDEIVKRFEERVRIVAIQECGRR